MEQTHNGRPTMMRSMPASSPSRFQRWGIEDDVGVDLGEEPAVTRMPDGEAAGLRLARMLFVCTSGSLVEGDAERLDRAGFVVVPLGGIPRTLALQQLPIAGAAEDVQPPVKCHVGRSL
jgi:hypothetical protein